jgi:UDP-2,3-diacylglucosamine pyrophosphatase LpxH
MYRNGVAWAVIADEYGIKLERARAIARNSDWYEKERDIRNAPRNNDIPYDAEEFDRKTINADSSIASEIKKRMQAKKVFTKRELLEVHALDPDEFEISNIISNEWSVTNGDGEKFWNYQSKISAKPKSKELTLDRVAEIIKDVAPVTIELLTDEVPEQYLRLPFYDMHFGLNTFEDYSYLLARVVDIIENSYEEILIIVGGDYIHVDNLQGTTEKGTYIDTVDFEKAVSDATKFLKVIIETALRYCPNVKLTYLPGNHAPSNDYMLMQVIKATYPDLNVDDAITEFKHAWLNNHAIFMHHGDKRKASNKIIEVIVSEYAKEWGEASSRYLITGHLHHERSLSNSGITHYQVMSPSKPSSYDKRMGYVTSEDGLMLIEFDKNKRSAIYYL